MNALGNQLRSIPAPQPLAIQEDTEMHSSSRSIWYFSSRDNYDKMLFLSFK